MVKTSSFSWGLTRLQYALIIIVLLASATVFVATRNQASDKVLDGLLAESLARFGDTSSYEQQVETIARFPDRSLRIEGIYRIDRGRMRFETISTTTLSFPGGPSGITFSLQNRALGRQVYVHVHTASPVLKGTIPSHQEWQHFSADAIPETYRGIAVPGPILDNLLVLSEKGAYLSSRGRPVRVSDGERMLVRYVFARSSKEPGPGTLQALLARIGNSGTITLWLDESTRQPVRLAFVGTDYHSTTTLSRLGETMPIEPPSLVR